MPRKFLIDGIELLCEDVRISLDDLRKLVKDGVTVDEVDNGEDMGHTYTPLIAEARHHLFSSPPEYQNFREKILLALVNAIRELFLTCGGGIDIDSSPKSLKFFFEFAVIHADITKKLLLNLYDCWKTIKEINDLGGWTYITLSDYPDFIPDAQNFVDEFAKFDRKQMWDDFNTNIIVGNDPDVDVKKDPHTVILNGIEYQCEYSVSANS